jgi:two-component system, cell cycle response regulator
MRVESSKDKIESLRELINTIIVSENYDADYLVEKSQELDILIVQAVKEMNFAKKVFGDNFISEFDIFLDEIKMVGNKYHSIRIVDPVTKEVLEIKKGELYTVDFCCYKFFEKQRVCENCISIRASNSNEIIMKIESFSNKAFLVTAIPILIHGKKLSVELFKDIREFKEKL